MPFGKFKTYEEVATKFHVTLKRISFVQEKELHVDKALFNFVASNLINPSSYISENALCETIIANILNIVKKEGPLEVWSHVTFNVSEADGLVGEPDFLIAPVANIGTTFTVPVLCVVEAKKDDFTGGWGQALATMIAVQKYNDDTEKEVFGSVTNGDIWQFGKLQGHELSMETVSYSATEDLQRLFNVIHWLFSEAEKRIT
jgi:hypothetical protein